jgi:hypothetical protein
VKAWPLVLKQHDVNDIARRGEVEMSSISDGRAVAAAIGRGFKSHQPDRIFKTLEEV